MEKTIFVSIASYRDIYCLKTLNSLYSNAKHPENMYVGLCIQNKEDDEDCFLKDEKYARNIRTIRLKDYEAKGPTWARYLCTTLINKEDYFLQIDSHTLFAKDWDDKLISMIDDIKKNTESKDVVISHYPPEYSDRDNQNVDNTKPNTICEPNFQPNGVISFSGSQPVSTTKYIKTPFVAAGMFFCEGKCIKDVPYDPNLPNLFIGEEILHSARIWTSGYDIYSPTQNVVYHLYTRSDQPHIWDDKKNYNDSDAVNKVKMLLKLDGGGEVPSYVNENIEKYGLGTKRSLEEFYEFAGINIKEKKFHKNFCQTVENYEGPPPKNSSVSDTKSIITKIIIVIAFLVGCLVLYKMFFKKSGLDNKRVKFQFNRM